MKVVIILGPQAVGKMTIGEELSKRLEVPLLFNHMTLDIIWPFIGWTPDTFRISQMIRKEIFEAVANNPDSPGIILTMLMFYDLQADWDILNEYLAIFQSRGIDVCLVELEADFGERLRRNTTENRMEKKPTKRDIERSTADLLGAAEKNRLNSTPGEITHPHYLRLDVTNLTPEESAGKIIERFWGS